MAEHPAGARTLRGERGSSSTTGEPKYYQKHELFADRERLSLAQLIQSPNDDREGRRRQHLGWTRLLAPLFTLILPVFSISCALLAPHEHVF